ncbi:MAG TPA: four helix bundle protein [Meiothermus sp.]|nr:four helix bundle protein [Meiothermus sp.]
MKDFRELKVWQKSHILTLGVYRMTLQFPREELYQLTSQIRRSASLIPTNIAEGAGRGGDPEFKRYLIVAYGSSSELDYQLILARDLGYLPQEKCTPLYQQLVEVQRMLHRLIQTIKADS